MPFHRIRSRIAAAVAIVLLCILYLTFLNGAGLVLQDEPRYAAIGKAMEASGDWVTPRLWGHAWFEKPPLLYWMTATGFSLGLGNELAPRLPVALLSAGFLVFLFLIVRREFGQRAAWFASSMLATSAGWFAYSHIAVTDLPLSVFLSTAMLLVMPRSDGKPIPTGQAAVAGVSLGLAILSKALVPIVLFLPAIWFLRRQWKNIALVASASIAVALPWFVLCYLRNGSAFVDDLIWKQHFARFTSDTLQHVRPFWYYVPVLLAGFFPWTPVLTLIFRKDSFRDTKNAFLLSWFLFGFVFFTASRNKLPGYLLPLLPPLAILAAGGLEKTIRPLRVLACAAILTGLIPAIRAVLPQALAFGVTRTAWEFPWLSVIASAVATFAVIMVSITSKGRREFVFSVPLIFIVCGYLAFLSRDLPVLDRTVSARRVWEERVSKLPDPRVSGLNRTLRFGICYYSDRQIPDCSTN